MTFKEYEEAKASLEEKMRSVGLWRDDVKPEWAVKDKIVACRFETYWEPGDWEN